MAHFGAMRWFCVATLLATLSACAADDSGGGSGGGANATVASPVGGTGGAGAGMMPHVGTGGSAPISGTGGTLGTMTPGGGGSAGMGGTMLAGTGGTPGVMPPPAGTGGMMAPPAGTGGMMAPVLVGPDQMLPPVTDYTAPGPFNPTTEVDNTGPDGMYTMYLPTNLDQNGFKFIPTTWGNGITTTPQTYPILLNTIASHGFVIIASNSTTVSADLMTAGLDWLIAQNDAAGNLQGKLDVDRAACIGYSLGGQASVGCGATHPKAVVTVAMHPAGGFPAGMKGPLLLFSGLMDDVCVRDSFVQPIFDQSPVPTFFGTLTDGTHYEPPLTGGRELAPMVAWLRLWVFGDEGAKPFFYGADCTLCKGDWTMPESKMLP
jgi:hypothetical protein